MKCVAKAKVVSNARFLAGSQISAARVQLHFAGFGVHVDGESGPTKVALDVALEISLCLSVDSNTFWNIECQVTEK